MEFLDVVKKRRSVRKYKDKEISDEVIEKLIDAARLAPTGMNVQAWKFVVVRDKERLKKLREMYVSARDKLGIYKQDTSFVEKAAVIFVYFDRKHPRARFDCFLAIENILLAATDLGLGSLCIGAFMNEENIKAVQEMCNVPLDYALVQPVVVGYADEKPKMPQKKELKEILFYEKFK